MVQHHHLEYMKLDSRKNSIFLPPRPLPAFFTLNFFLSLFLFFSFAKPFKPKLIFSATGEKRRRVERWGVGPLIHI